MLLRILVVVGRQNVTALLGSDDSDTSDNSFTQEWFASSHSLVWFDNFAMTTQQHLV